MAITKANLVSILAILGGMIIFKGSSHIDVVETFIKDQPIITVVIGFLIFFNRHKIADKLGLKS